MALSEKDKTLSQEDQAKILEAQNNYANAKTQEEKNAYHADAETIRWRNGYSGGEDGSGTSSSQQTDNTTTQSAAETAAREAGANAEATGQGGYSAAYKAWARSQNSDSSGAGSSSNGYTYDTSGLTDTLKSWLDTAKSQVDTSTDYATNQAITELQRAEEDAKVEYDAQREQIAIDEQKALANQALYAEARGDKGGIGQAQYNSIMNTAAQNRLTVNQAQTKLSTDTARQITDLRAQGEYEKADAYLELTQNYLSQLMSLEQWSLEFGLSVEQFNQSLAEWQAEYDLKLADITGEYQGQQTLASKQMLAEAGLTLAQNGITPSSSQLSAMKELYGYDSATVSSLVALANQKASKSSSSGSVTTSIANGASIVGLAVNYLGSNATKSDFTNWVKSNTELSTDSQISQAWKDYSGINWYAAAEKFWRDEIEKYAGTEAKVSAIEKCGLSNEAKTYLLAKLGVI